MSKGLNFFIYEKDNLTYLNSYFKNVNGENKDIKIQHEYSNMNSDSSCRFVFDNAESVMSLPDFECIVEKRDTNIYTKSEDFNQISFSSDATNKNANHKKYKKGYSLNQPETRWSKDNDKDLFKVIRILEKEEVLSLEYLLSINPNFEAARSEQVKALVDCVGWTGPIRNLIKRIQTLCKPSLLSVRELRLLKKKIKKKYSQCDIDFEDLVNEFPGKTLDFIALIALKIKEEL
jgi:hypothetical protein